MVLKIITEYDYSIRTEPESACAPIESKPIEREPIESEPIKSEASWSNFWFCIPVHFEFLISLTLIRKMLRGGARESENQVHTNDISLGAWNSLPAAFGAGPFSVHFKTLSHAPMSRWASGKWNLHSHQFFLGLALFFPKRQKTTSLQRHARWTIWNSLLAVFGSGPFSVQFKP